MARLDEPAGPGTQSAAPSALGTSSSAGQTPRARLLGRLHLEQAERTDSDIGPPGKQGGGMLHHSPLTIRDPVTGSSGTPADYAWGMQRGGTRPALNPGNTGVCIPVPTSHANLGKTHLPWDPAATSFLRKCPPHTRQGQYPHRRKWRVQGRPPKGCRPGPGDMEHVWRHSGSPPLGEEA